jgi:hypothetical protein
MREDVAAVNVTRSYTLAGTNIAIFTFMLFFLYPRFESGRINPLLVPGHADCDGCRDLLTCVRDVALLQVLARRRDE